MKTSEFDPVTDPAADYVVGVVQGGTNKQATRAQIRDGLAADSHNHAATALTGFTEGVQDVVGALVVAAGGSYDDTAGSVVFPGGGGGGGSGDVVGPASATADALVQYSGTTGKLVKDGPAIPAGGLAGITALNLKANSASPAFTGTPTAPTATAGTSTTQLATTAFVAAAVSALIAAAPGALDTLDELAAALGDDANFAASMTTALALKAPLASPSLTGTPLAPTAAAGTNTTQLATTAFTRAEILSRVLTGWTEGADATIAATDTVLAAFGKTQGQISAVKTSLESKAEALAPVAITNATTLTVAAHANRQLRYSGTTATLAWPSDAGTDDLSVEIVTLAGSAGNVTITTPDGKSVTGAPGRTIGIVRKGANVYDVGTTDIAGGSSEMTGEEIVDAIDVELGSADWQTLLTGEDIVDAVDTELASTAWRTAPTGAATVSAIDTELSGSGWRTILDGEDIALLLDAYFGNQVWRGGGASSPATVLSAVIENATPSLITLTFSAALTSADPSGAGGITLSATGGAVTVTAVDVTGTTVALTLSRAIAFGETVTRTYAAGSSSVPFANANGNVADFSAAGVTNNVADTTPTFTSRVIADGAPNVLVLTSSAALTSADPTGAGGLVLTMSGGAVTVTAVDVTGVTTNCTLSRSIAAGETGTLAYTSGSSSVPFANAGGSVANFSGATITNNVSGVTFQVQELFDGGSKDTSKFMATTPSIPWDSGVTIGGTDTQAGGAGTFTPTAGSNHAVGRATFSSTLDIEGGNRAVIHIDPTTFAQDGTIFTFGYGTGGENVRFQITNDLGGTNTNIVIEALANNFGSSGTAFSDDFDANAANYAFLDFGKEVGGDITLRSAPNVSGVPGTWIERRRIISGADENISLASGRVYWYTKNDNSSATPSGVVVREFYVTDV